MRPWIVAALALTLAAPSARAEGLFSAFTPGFIAALGDPRATSGEDAETWGLWRQDPGPRGVELSDFAALQARGGVTSWNWTFDPKSWWLEEHGLIMESPAFPLPAGEYVVTGGRQVTAKLIVDPPDPDGHQHWQLSDGATLHDVTHLGCRSAVYTPEPGAACSPEAVNPAAFPVSPGAAMPPVAGCRKQDYQVLILIGMKVAG
jgi:hypothetical protein